MPPQEARRSALGRWTLCRTGALLLLVCCSLRTGTVDAADEADEPAEAEQKSAAVEDPPEKPPRSNNHKELNDGAGAQFRAGVVQGQGVVQDQSLAPIELFPFFLYDDSMFFSDFRFFPTFDLTFGGNVGTGYRYYSPSLDRVFGISGWYDADGTRDNYFQQLGLSLETYGGPFDVRSNLYLPVGDTYRQTGLAVVNNTTRFEGDNVLFNQLRTFTSAMKGVDVEAGVPIPGAFSAEHGIRVYGGFYHFFDDHGDHITGGSARAQANIVSGLDAGVQVTNDAFFNTRAFFTLAWTFGPLHPSQLSQKTGRGRLGEHVTRNYTVLAPVQHHIEKNITAADPATGLAYRFAHVDSAAAAGGDGSAANPYQTIAQGQSASRDIIFVHAGSTFTGADATIAMNPGERILGDGAGVRHSLQVKELGSIVLPYAAASTSLPVLGLASGNAVTLASNSEFSGFTVLNPSGSGLYGTGVQNVTSHDVTINGAAGPALQLINPVGVSTFNNVSILNSLADGLSISGGDAHVQFGGQFAGNLGHDAIISNTTGGLVDLTNAQFAGAASKGILLQNDAGNATFKDVSVTNSTADGIAVIGNSGQVNFLGTTRVSGAADTSVSIQNLAAGGAVNFDALAINNRHDRGLLVDNAAGNVTVANATTIANEVGSTGSGVDIRNSSGNVTFGDATVSNAIGDPGVALQNNTGTTTFKSLNISTLNGTALFADTAGSLVVNSAITQGAGGTIQAINGLAADIKSTALNVNLASISSSGAPMGLRLISTPGLFAVSGDTHGTPGSGGTIQGASAGVFLQDVGTVGLVSLNLGGNAVGIHSERVLALGLSNVQLVNSTSYGIDAIDTNNLVVMNSALIGNGAANIHAQFSQVASYAYTINNSTLISSLADNVLLQSLAGGAGSTLSLTMSGNDIRNSHVGTAGVNVNFNGTLSATVTGNAFSASGGTNTGVLINNGSTTGLTTTVLDNNRFGSTGGTDTAFRVITAGPSQNDLSGNVVQFSAPGGTGMRLSLGVGSSTSLLKNAIVDVTDGGTGILFDSIVGPANVAFGNNLIQLANLGTLADRGIIFASVTNTINLSGTNDNRIFGADVPFFAPAGATTGSIFVNNVPVH